MSTVELKLQIANVIAEATSVNADEVLSLFELPKDPSHGDFALPCFRFAKQLRKAPPAIATELATRLGSGQLPAGVSKVVAAGGYLNFFTDAAAVSAGALLEVLEAGSAYGSSLEGAGKRVVVEFSSVNIAKPFGIAHLRTTILGAALARVYAKLGYETIRINHIGDWGTQFGNLIAAYKLWGSEYSFEPNPITDLYKLYVRFHAAAETDKALEERGRAEFRQLEQGDPENTAIWQRFIEYSMIDFNRVYELLHVKFDHFTGEAFYRDKMAPVLQRLEELGLLQESEGAQIVDLSAYDMPPCLMKKSDDSSLYATRDLTALLYRKATFDFHKLLYVVGTSQKLHFQQFFKVAELMGNDWVKDAIHVDFGWVKFGDRMFSTRSGNLIFFEDVLAQARDLAKEVIVRENQQVENIDWTAERVAVAAIVFTQLRVRRHKDVNFIWEEALSFRGETGPYLQYTHARLSSLERKYAGEVPDLEADFTLFGDEEKQIIKRFELYPQKLRLMLEVYETNVLTDYLTDLASTFNSYWQRIRIISDDAAPTRARMQMAHAVRTIIGDGLRLLGIEPLERM